MSMEAEVDPGIQRLCSRRYIEVDLGAADGSG